MTPLMFVERAGAVQLSSTNAVSTNARLRWEYRPGSELFVVYNDERNTLTPRLSRAQHAGVHREGEPAVPLLILVVRRAPEFILPFQRRRVRP